MSQESFTFKIQPVRDYNSIDYRTPVSFNLIINHKDIELIEALREKINDWLKQK